MVDLDLRELSDKYCLPVDVIRTEIEKTVSSVLSKRFSFDVDAHFTKNNIEIYGYPETKTLYIDIKNIKRHIIREIKYTLSKNLTLESVLKDYRILKPLISNIIYGKIIRTDRSGDVYAALEHQSVVAVCKLHNQTPKERWLYNEGQRMAFYALRMNVFLQAGTPRLEVNLSRTSKGLPEKLLKESLAKKNISNIEVRCEKRISGAFSVIRASQKVPRDCIKETADELKERIEVFYAK